MGSILNISVSGMSAAQVGLQTVQHNVANASTDGYSRQRVTQTSTTPNSTGQGFIGTGTMVSSVSRLYDQFLTGQVNRSQTTLSALKATSTQMDAIDQLLADPSAGIAPSLEEFFSAAQEVGAYPASVASRQTMVSAAEVMVNRFAVMGETINSLNDQINLQVQTDVDALNSYANQLADVNDQITRAAGTGYQPNDLLDKRDQIISEMGKLADISTTLVTTSGKGAAVANEYAPIQVYVGNGHPLVADSGANPVTVVSSSADPTQLTFSMDGQEIKPGDVTGGSLGGLITFRNSTLAKTQNALGQVAYALASTFNEQHKTGMDLLGGQGGDFFTIPSTVAAVGYPSSAPALTVSLTTPKLTGDTTTDFYKTTVTNSDYTLALKGGTYTLTRATDGHTWTGGSIANINAALTDQSPAAQDPQYIGEQGFSINDPGSIADGNSFEIRPMAQMSTNIGVSKAIVGDVRLFAGGLAVKASMGAANQGSMGAVVNRMTSAGAQSSVGITNPGLVLTFDGANLTGIPGSVEVTGTDGKKVAGSPFVGTAPYYAGASYNVGGIVFTTSGTPSAGDTINLNRNDLSANGIGVSDSSNLLLLAQLQTRKAINGATTYGGSYAQMVADVGNDAATSKTTIASQQSLFDLAKSRKEAYAGVNLDEEAANLVYYQQIYQANAKALQAGQKLFDTLMSIMG